MNRAAVLLPGLLQLHPQEKVMEEGLHAATLSA